jgi:hypothetical protein
VHRTRECGAFPVSRTNDSEVFRTSELRGIELANAGIFHVTVRVVLRAAIAI